MKVIKGLVLFCFLAVCVSACFEPPEFTNTPEISYSKIQFKEVEGAGTNDSLILYINFKDGDGDLGLDQNNLEYSAEPYQSSYYFLTTAGCSTGQCDTTKVSTQIVEANGVPYFLLKSNGIAGKLVTNKTRLQPGYSYLPTYTNNNCEFYSPDKILVPAAAADASYNITDTLQDNLKNNYYVIEEPMLYKKNPNHYNIEVKFFVFENGNFVEFNWNKLCYEYDGRFPFLSSQSSALEGTIRYGMGNPSFLPLFSVKSLKLEVRIRDRALNVSNKVSTQQFTLDGIRVN